MKFKENIPLAHFSSFKIGGPARYFFEPENQEEVIHAVGEWENITGAEFRKRLFIFGGGTNLLISDSGFDGFVILPKILFLKRDGNRISAGAGVLMADLLKFTVRENLSGLEWAGGLPGTFGGAIRGNAGCFGGETKDAVESVESFSLSARKTIKRNSAECAFAYRSSIFKERGDEIILSATLRLKEGDREAMQKSIDEKIAYRMSHHPMEYPNIGSIFKNVAVSRFPKEKLARVSGVMKQDPLPVIPTAYLISEVGLSGVSIGGAMFSPKHPNFIVNTLGARAEDVYALIGLAKQEVKKEFNVDLEQEVQSV